MDDKNQFVSGLTVGPVCFIDGRKHGRRKQRFTLFNAALGMINSSPKEKSRENKKLVNRKDDKINGNNNSPGKNTEGWKKFVGSMRPLHMQTSQSPSSSPQHSQYSDSALSCPLPATTSSNSSTSRYSSPNNNLQELENMGTMSTSGSPNNFQELASTGSSGTISPNNLQELVSTGSSGTMSPSVSPNNLQEPASTGSSGTMSSSVSPNNLQELASTGSSGTMSPIVTTDNLQEVEGTMRLSASCNNLKKLSNTGTMNTSVSADDLQHRLSSGNLRGLERKGKMSSRKSTSNLQNLSLEKMRQYISALNLHDLDLNEEIEVEEDSDDKLLENCGADILIDVKADQFIKKFYLEMKSQHKGRNARRRH